MNQRGIVAVQALVGAAIVVLIGFIGYRMGGNAVQVKWDAVEKQRWQQHVERLDEARQREVAAGRHAMRVGENLAAAHAAIETERRKTRDALRTSNEGRACLNARTVQLLNDQHSGVSAGNETAGGQQPAADPEAAATDTDVAGWISDAKAQYESCRQQVIKWNDWYEGQP